MSSSFQLRSAAILALLLQAMVLAAPAAGACGLCDGEDGCQVQQAVQPGPDNHSCCEPESDTPPDTNLGSSSCECGREAPPALGAEISTTTETASSRDLALGQIDPASSGESIVMRSVRPPTPPLAPPTYLIDCAFLT